MVRRSPRIEAAANDPPTAALIMRVEAEEALRCPRKTRSATAARLARADRRQKAMRHGNNSRLFTPHANFEDENADADEDDAGEDDDADEGLDDDADADEEEDVEAEEEEDDDADADDESDGDGEQEEDGARGRAHVPSVNQTVTVQVVDELVYVTPPDKLLHTSWSAWSAVLDEYMARTSQVICVKEVVSVANRNRRIASSKVAKSGGKVRYVPDEWTSYQRTYICTHGWADRDRSTGERVTRYLRSTGCPFRFLVQVIHDDGEWKLVVKNACYAHNHVVSEAAVATHPSKRGVKDPANIAQVANMVRAGVKRSRIYDFLWLFIGTPTLTVQQVVVRYLMLYDTADIKSTLVAAKKRKK